MCVCLSIFLLSRPPLNITGRTHTRVASGASRARRDNVEMSTYYLEIPPSPHARHAHDRRASSSSEVLARLAGDALCLT